MNHSPFVVASPRLSGVNIALDELSKAISTKSQSEQSNRVESSASSGTEVVSEARRADLSTSNGEKVGEEKKEEMKEKTPKKGKSNETLIQVFSEQLGFKKISLDSKNKKMGNRKIHKKLLVSLLEKGKISPGSALLVSGEYGIITKRPQILQNNNLIGLNFSLLFLWR